jgi:hypothetical protein
VVGADATPDLAQAHAVLAPYATPLQTLCRDSAGAFPETCQQAYFEVMSHWLSVSIVLPDERQRVLTWDFQRGVSVGYWLDRDALQKGRYWNINGISGGFGGRRVKPPTHWMPLPAPPL